MFPTDRDGENDEEQEQTEVGGGHENEKKEEGTRLFSGVLRRIFVRPEPVKQHVCFGETQPVTCTQTDLCTIPTDCRN